MRPKMLTVLAILAICVVPVSAQETPASVVAAYDAMADTILSIRQTEQTFVAAMLDGHLHAAKALMSREDWEGAAAQMALFANEGDNGIGGVRKRLLEGGHHFNADGEEQGIYEPGYVIVTREAKKTILDASVAMRQAGSEEERQAAWHSFVAAAKPLLATD